MTGKKKVVGSRIDTWNRGYKPGGGNLKIYNKGVRFKHEDKEEPEVETWDETRTKYRGVITVQTEPEEPEEATVEVIERPFEVERISRTVQVSRERKKPPTPPPPPPQFEVEKFQTLSRSIEISFHLDH